MKKGLASILIAGTLLTTSCATKRQFAENHLHNNNVIYSKTTNKDIPYKKEINTLFNEKYYFKEADNNYKNALDFEIVPEKYSYDRFNPKKKTAKIDYEHEFVPLRIKSKNGKWATQLEIVDYKASIEDIEIENKFQKTIITEKGKKYKLPAVKVKGQEYLVLKALHKRPGMLDLYFTPFTKNLEILIDEKGNITLENLIEGFYRPGVDQKDTKNSSSKTTAKIKEKTNNKEEEIYHKIEKGDTYWSLAEEYWGTGKESDEIQKLNPNINPTKLKIGQKIRVK
jgi:LysM repeat protein